MGSTDKKLEGKGATKGQFGWSLVFIPFSGSEKEDFLRFPFFKSLGNHLGCKARPPDTTPMSITSKFGPIWPSGSWEDGW